MRPRSAGNPAARANLEAFARSRGKRADGELAIGWGGDDSTIVIKPPAGYRKEFRPPAQLPATHALAVVDEVAEGGTRTRVYADARRGIALLLRNGAIRLALYRSPRACRRVCLRGRGTSSSCR